MGVPWRRPACRHATPCSQTGPSDAPHREQRRRTATGRAVPTAKSRRLVIVESPAKARTISGYLGPGYVVEASLGHVRDLPRNAADVPARYKKEPWARLGVDVDHDFAALYVVSPDRRQQIAKLSKLAKEVDEVYLATD